MCARFEADFNSHLLQLQQKDLLRRQFKNQDNPDKLYDFKHIKEGKRQIILTDPRRPRPISDSLGPPPRMKDEPGTLPVARPHPLPPKVTYKDWDSELPD
mmetsp:Transcript_24181/g.37191  ORF Transcript_24181/g.37191 Transcript_24181/m.37191 type:complete len:100 (+) Transcript_24181:598-897(+)